MCLCACVYILGRARLRLAYLAEQVALQLEPMDEPRVPISPPPFMLAPESMIDENLDLWEDGIDFSV